MIGYSKGGTGYCLIKVDNLFDDVTEAKGIDNIPLVSDVTYRPEQRARISGTVIQEPLFMGGQPIFQTSIGFPGYGPIRHIPDHDSDETISTSLYSQGYYNYKVMSDIEPEVRLNDKIWFKWRVLHNRRNLIAETKNKSGDREYIFRCPYDHIYCTMRDGKILPIGSHVFLEPVMEEFDDILIKTYSNVKGLDGKFILKDKKFWIQSKVVPQQKDRQAIVRHIGKPLRGDTRYLNEGDRVLYKPNLKSLLTIEGKRYFIVLADMIIAKIAP